MGKGFNPNQPRWSKGSEVGGEWRGPEKNILFVKDASYKNKSVPEPTIMPEPVTKPVVLKHPLKEHLPTSKADIKAWWGSLKPKNRGD